ncbi:Histidine kinase-, DNA gyrase B-, and HSP90-like ATPase [Chitinophaga sp. YR573]|uniref:sensor histidine kinase n=1 Tax=Chitinophaga sp. YR573 TaxID=1881040 RepID=UPI0008AC1DA9|nr:histidine kinase [Chitinophaga sp. YR573]SEW44379.1 Histidine kinase-, DNA gyrase B-, and HSP90-like ATPase [Chitinophaga sp. YR573]
METIKDLSFLDTLLPLAVVIFIIGIGVVFLNLHFQRNLTVQKLKQEALKNLYQNDLLRSNIHAQEEERKRIAHDLHDELGAVISIMRMHLMVLEQQSTGNLQDGLLNVRQLAETALGSIRSISHQLMPPQLESFGLLTTLESVISQINQTDQIIIELTYSDALEDLPWIVNLGLFRIVMELINNTIKHANAKSVKIDFLRYGQHLTCHYSDDGVGLTKDNINKGLGHKSIEGRVNSLGGKLEFGNGETNGFYAIIELTVSI